MRFPAADTWKPVKATQEPITSEEMNPLLETDRERATTELDSEGKMFLVIAQMKLGFLILGKTELQIELI